MDHIIGLKSLFIILLRPGEWAGDVGGFGEEDVMPCGHILWLRRASISDMEAGAKFRVTRVLRRVLELAPECCPVSQVRF